MLQLYWAAMTKLQLSIHRIRTFSDANEPEVQSLEGFSSEQAELKDAFIELRRAALRRAGKDYVSCEKDLPFSQALKELQADDRFDTFNEQLASQIKHVFASVESGLNGYLFTALEKLEAGSALHMYFAEKREHYSVENDLTVAKQFTLNTDGVAFGCKINMHDVFDDNERAMQACMLLRARGDKSLNSAFEKLIAVGDKKDIASETDTLINTINQYTEALPEEAAHFTKAHVVNYCLEQEKAGEPVKLKSLSRDLSEQFETHGDGYTPPAKFDQFALQNNEEIKPEFIPDKNKLKSYIRISGRNEQMSMSFSSSCLGDSVVYDSATDSLIVKSIPSALKARLIKHVQGS